MDNELKAALDGLSGETKRIFSDLAEKHATLQRQVDAIDTNGAHRHTNGVVTKSLEDVLKEDEGLSRLRRDGKGTCIVTLEGENAALLAHKTTITSSTLGSATSGVLEIDRVQGIVPEARQQLFLRDVLTSRPTGLGTVDFVRVTTPMSKASPQIQASAKLENQLVLGTTSERVRTLATWIPATKQVLEDLTELASFIDSSLRYALDLSEEQQMLFGSGNIEDLHGVGTQAASFSTALLGSGSWNYADVIARAVQQISTAKEFQPSFIAMDVASWWAIRLTKSTTGEYLMGDPMSDVTPRLFGLRVIPTTNMAASTFLVGSGDPSVVEIRDRMQTQIEVSTSHEDYWTRNLVAIRGERRLALVVKRPNAAVTGSFTTSP